ncbi:MAG: VanW family protein [Oscillospiraceae bacterium]|nr:VanW family protein [Oscillospiraceae bacterium]
MKKFFKISLVLVLALGAVLALSACGTDEPEYSSFYSDNGTGETTASTPETTVPPETKPELKDEEIVSYVQGLVEEIKADLRIKIYCGNSFVYVDAVEAGSPVDMSLVGVKLDELGYDGAEIMEKYWSYVGEPETVEGESSVNREAVEAAVERLYDDCKRRASSDFSVDGNKLTVIVGEKQYCVKKTATVSAVVDALEAADYSDIEAEYDLRNPDMHWKDILPLVTVEGHNAYYEYVSKTENAKLVPEVKGYILTQANVQPVYENAKTGEVLEFTAEPWDPEITTENINEIMFSHEIASKSSYYNYNLVGRTANVKLAAEFINGAVIMPGQYFSFNGTVGERTRERGFQEATIYENGEMTDGLGGGICQVSSTIYAAAMRAGLLEGNRANHQFTVDYVALGEDATVYWDGGLDYRFKNTLDAPIMIKAVANGGLLEISIWGTEESDVFTVYIEHENEKVEQKMKFEEDPDGVLKPGEKEEVRKGKPGYKVKTTIYIYKNGEYYSTKKYTDEYDPYHGLTYLNKHDLTSSETSETTTETEQSTTVTEPSETTTETPPTTPATPPATTTNTTPEPPATSDTSATTENTADTSTETSSETTTESTTESSSETEGETVV